MKTKSPIFLFLLLPLAAMLQQCAAPTFSDIQSARLVGKGNAEMTPNYSAVSFKYDGESESAQKHIGAQFAYGLSDNVDLRFRFERITVKEEDYKENYNVIAIGPKFNIARDRVAFYLPLGFELGYIGETIQIQPTFLFTVPIVKDQVDFNPSIKYIQPFDGEGLVAVNFGAAIGKDVKRWAVRPEYGILFNPGDDGKYVHFSVGLSYKFSKKTD